MHFPSFLLSALLALSPCLGQAEGTSAPSDLFQGEKPATIKVLIGDKKDKILLEARGHYLVSNPLNEMELDRGIMTKRAYVSSSIEGLKWNGFFPGVFQIRITPTDDKSSLLIDGIEYRGCIEIYALGGKLHVINEVDIERYVKALLTPQFTSDLGKDVLEAIAILARTQAYAQASKTAHAYWHVKAEDVGYCGYGLSLQNPSIDTAVNTTRYLVLTHNHLPFETSWTQNSAGRTADFSTIFRKESPGCKGVETPFAKKDRDKSAWSFSLSHQELARLLQLEGILAIDLYQDPHTQKVYAVRIKDKNGSHDIDFLTLQQRLSAKRLRSSDFTIQTRHDQISFQGFGEGHGVGLCLYSASKMSSHGESAPKILSTFFPEARLEILHQVKEGAH